MWALGAVVVLLVTSPALLTNRGFGPDFTNHLWLVWNQGDAISHAHRPTIFLHTTDFSFEPYFGFYGGTLYAVTGALSALVGHASVAYLASIVGAFACAYVGFVWLARIFGLRGWRSHAPAIVAVTSPYLVMDLLARGAWPEFVALCGIPLVVAGALELLRTGPRHARHILGFALGVVVFTGSHNLTLFWGTLVLVPLTAGLLALLGERPPPRRVAEVAGLGLLGAGVNAWFLGLDLLHSGDVMAAHQPFDWKSTAHFNALGPLLNPLRGDAPGTTTPGLTVALPVLALAWALVVLVRRRDFSGRAQRVMVLLFALLALLVFLMTQRWLWNALGQPFTYIQFPYRLVGYMTLLVAGMLLCGLVIGGGRRLDAVLVVVLGLSLVQGTAQAWDAGTHHSKFALQDRREVFAKTPLTLPASWYDPGFYNDASLPTIDPPIARNVRLPIPAPGATSQRAVVALPEGPAPIALQLGGGPYVIRLDGLRAVGHTSGGGRAVVVRTANLTGPVAVGVHQVGGLALTGGAIVSVLSVLALLGLAVVLPRRRRGER